MQLLFSCLCSVLIHQQDQYGYSDRNLASVTDLVLNV